MIPRYSLPEMSDIWSEENRFKLMLKIELTVLEVLAKKHIVDKNDYSQIVSKIKLDIPRIKEIEKITKHDLASFVDQISESVGTSSARWIHFGLTSSDILDTATAIQLKLSCQQIIKRLKQLSTILLKQAKKYKDTLMIGRTHGVHAEPITFGYKLLNWYTEIKQHISVMEFMQSIISVGKISGVVGTYSQLSPEIEKQVLQKLGLTPEPVSTQVIPRYRYSYYISALACIGASIERFATEIRHLQRSEVFEVEEHFTTGQKGSSAMPHKRNPVESEKLCGLARLLRGYAYSSFENVALWHERDISHSSVERIILPDANIVTDYIIYCFTNIVRNLVVYEENMLSNLKKMFNIYFSQTILTELIKKGLLRDEAYRMVQSVAHKAIKEKKDFVSLIKLDKKIKKYLSDEEITKICSIKYLLRNIDKKFKEILKNK